VTTRRPILRRVLPRGERQSQIRRIDSALDSLLDCETHDACIDPRLTLHTLIERVFRHPYMDEQTSQMIAVQVERIREEARTAHLAVEFLEAAE